MTNILLIFSLYLISAQVGCDGSVKVKAYERGSVIINYKYNQDYSKHTKYFCKVKDQNCQTLLSQTDKKWDHERKFFAMDGAGLFSMLIRNLTQEDGGNYRCGVKNQKEAQLDVELEVENGQYNGKSFLQTSYPGDTVTFSCTYPEEAENDMKIVYKVASQNFHAVIFTYKGSEKKGKSVLNVSSSTKVMHMSICNVTAEDGGLYLCGVLKLEPLYVSILSEMQLQVTDVITSDIITADVITADVITADMPLAPGSPVILITVCVGVALLLIAGFALSFYKLWSTRTEGAFLPANRRKGEMNEERDQYTGAVYYEDVHTPDVVYATIQKAKTFPMSANLAAGRSTSSLNNVDHDFYSMVQLLKKETTTETTA